MASNAIITSVERLPDGQVEIKIGTEGGITYSGQESFTILNPPLNPENLIGQEIWEHGSDVLIGSKHLAKKYGETSLRWKHPEFLDGIVCFKNNPKDELFAVVSSHEEDCGIKSFFCKPHELIEIAKIDEQTGELGGAMMTRGMNIAHADQINWRDSYSDNVISKVSMDIIVSSGGLEV